jgi:hypothetical protein
MNTMDASESCSTTNSGDIDSGEISMSCAHENGGNQVNLDGSTNRTSTKICTATDIPESQTKEMKTPTASTSTFDTDQILLPVAGAFDKNDTWLPTHTDTFKEHKSLLEEEEALIPPTNIEHADNHSVCTTEVQSIHDAIENKDWDRVTLLAKRVPQSVLNEKIIPIGTLLSLAVDECAPLDVISLLITSKNVNYVTGYAKYPPSKVHCCTTACPMTSCGKW